ncbi:MAG TPA: hypothetical protein VM099_13585, partial [Gemmatimonadaceae bacterium]|nr:hypothetical protein [Gemmatimonadaceae bacterium]
MSIASLHSVQTLTSTLGNETRERFIWIVRLSNLVVTGFRQLKHVPDEMSPSLIRDRIVFSPLEHCFI